MRINIISWGTVAVFLVVVYGALAQTFTETHTVSIGAIVGSIPSVDEGGGGGGGRAQSGVRFSGLAYPNALVTVQKLVGGDTLVRADAGGAFSVVIADTSNTFFTLFATDGAGRRSTILNFPTVAYSGYLTDISGIRFAPTIALDKLVVKQGDFITVSGVALPNLRMEVLFEGPETRVFTLNTDGAVGSYNLTVPLDLVQGDYTARIRYVDDARSSKAIRLIVGTTTILKAEATANIPGDCNVDGRIDLVDFSVLAYWFGKSKPPVCVDPNHDGTVTLVDFSIVAFYWNG